MTKKPTNKTNRPLFSSGPCAKFPNWQINKIETSILGRSHRAKKPKDFINRLIPTSIHTNVNEFLISLLPFKLDK